MIYLRSVNSTQARRLKKLGFDLEVQDLFIINKTRRYMTETMEIGENWNKFDDTLSRPSIALSLEWMRQTFYCKCEVEIADWKKGTYIGRYYFEDMEEAVTTKAYQDRYRAESYLLSAVIEHQLYHRK